MFLTAAVIRAALQIFLSRAAAISSFSMELSFSFEGLAVKGLPILWSKSF